MESKFSNYDVESSDERIKEILDSAERFEEVNSIPARTSLTYSNGFYVNCTAIFIDIRGSSKLTETHINPVLGKLYRAYISECIAVLNANESCKEVFISGDCVSGIFDSTYKNQIVRVFETAGQLSSLIEMLNWRLKNKNYQPIICGIGMSFGRALMIKAGAKGSGINDVVWMGDVVNEAAHLCHKGNKDSRLSLQLSKSVFENLTSEYQGFCSEVGLKGLFEAENYQTDIFNVSMRQYLGENKMPDGDIQSILAALLNNPKYPTGLSIPTLLS